MMIPILMRDSKEKHSMICNRKGVLRTDNGILYDVLRLNTTGCASIVLDGTTYINPALADTNAATTLNDDDATPVDPAILSPELSKLAGKALAVTIKRKIPEAILKECRIIMQLIYNRHKTEGAVMVLFDTNTNEYSVYVPKQEVSGTLCSIEPEDSCAPLNEHTIVAASFHSHPFGGGHGFLSGTDHDNADSIPDAPISSFNFSTAPIAGTNLFKFGIMQPEFCGIPLEPLDFCESIPELVQVGEAEEAQYKEILDERVSHHTYTYSYGGGASNYWKTHYTTDKKKEVGGTKELGYWWDDDYYDYGGHYWKESEKKKESEKPAATVKTVFVQEKTLAEILADYFGCEDDEMMVDVIKKAEKFISKAGGATLWKTGKVCNDDSNHQTVRDFLETIDRAAGEAEALAKVEAELKTMFDIDKFKSPDESIWQPVPVLAAVIAHNYNGKDAWKMRTLMQDLTSEIKIEESGDPDVLEMIQAIASTDALVPIDEKSAEQIEINYIKYIRDMVCGAPTSDDWKRVDEVLDAVNTILEGDDDSITEFDKTVEAAIKKIDMEVDEKQIDYPAILLILFAMYWDTDEADEAKSCILNLAAKIHLTEAPEEEDASSQTTEDTDD